jgi:hypothetical protein
VARGSFAALDRRIDELALKPPGGKRTRGKIMRWTQQSLVRARGIVMIVFGVFLLVASLVWR